jgi:hypothetical protein
VALRPRDSKKQKRVKSLAEAKDGKNMGGTNGRNSPTSACSGSAIVVASFIASAHFPVVPGPSSYLLIRLPLTLALGRREDFDMGKTLGPNSVVKAYPAVHLLTTIVRNAEASVYSNEVMARRGQMEG